MALHRAERAANNVSTDSNSRKFAVCLDQRRDSPKSNNCKHEQNAAPKLEALRQFDVSHKEFHRGERQERRPGDWSLCEETERKRQIKEEPPRPGGLM